MINKVIDLLKGKEECKVPLCTNERDKKQDWPFCTDCMINSTRRFMIAEDTFKDGDVERAKHWINFICKHWPDLVEAEKKVIKERGPDYDRDAE